MTVGIYSLNFIGTTKLYIGQSINIEARYAQHLSKLRLNKANSKLQEAYSTFGIPEYRILIECVPENLNTLEEEAISIFDSVNNGFNVLSIPGAPLLFGEKVGTSTQSNETYKKILLLLIRESPSLTYKEISRLTGASESVIRHIDTLESHSWLSEEMPEEYNKLVSIKKSTPYLTRGANYPKIQNPAGSVYEVFHVSNFAKEHGLLQPKLTEVLAGTRKYHKGWHLTTTEPASTSQIVISPEGEKFEIPKGKGPAFCKNKGLTYSNFWKLLTGKSLSYRGWVMDIGLKI